MTALKLIGSGLVILFGAAAGRSLGDYLMDKYRTLEVVVDMLRRLLMILEYEQPTVDEMLSRVSVTDGFKPVFLLAAAAGREALISSLHENKDGMSDPDRTRLETLVRELGSADKTSEQQRLSAALTYFTERATALRPRAESNKKLSRSLGLLGGIFIVVLLV